MELYSIMRAIIMLIIDIIWAQSWVVLVIHRRYGSHVEYCGVTKLLQYEQIVPKDYFYIINNLQPLLKGDGRWYTFFIFGCSSDFASVMFTKYTRVIILYFAVKKLEFLHLWYSYFMILWYSEN